LEMSMSAALSLADASLKERSRLMDVDAIEAASRMALNQRALEAALEASAQSFKLSLLDKL